METSAYLLAIEDLPLGKNPHPPPIHGYPLNGNLGGSKSPLRHLGEGTNLLTLLGIEPSFLSHPTHSLVPVSAGYAIQAPLRQVHQN